MRGVSANITKPWFKGAFLANKEMGGKDKKGKLTSEFFPDSEEEEMTCQLLKFSK